MRLFLQRMFHLRPATGLLLLGCLLPGFVLPGFAQRTATTPGPAAEAGSISGSVVSVTGEPLRKVMVIALPRGGSPGGGRQGRPGPAPGPGNSSRTVSTDDSGAFRIEGLPPGAYTLSARRNGYVPTEYGRGPGQRSAEIRVSGGANTPGVRLQMTPHAVITGRVVDEDGDPVQGANVQVLRERFVNGRRQHIPLNAGGTNDLGEFRVSGLMPGRYVLQVSYHHPSSPDGPERREADSVHDLTYTPLYYPGVLDISQATPVQTASGQEFRAGDLRLRRTPTWRVRGRVLDSSGKPAQFVGVVAMPAQSSLAGVRSMGMVRNAEGTFEIAGLSPGTWNLLVQRAGRSEERQFGRTRVVVGNGDLEGVTITLQPTLTVSGTVRTADKSPLPAGLRVGVEMLETAGVPSYGATGGEVKPDGTWTMNGLSPGQYRFTLARPPEGTYVKSVQVTGQDILSGAAIEASATGVEIVLAPNAPEVSGTAVDAEGQPVAGATLVLVPDSSKRSQHWLFRTTSSDEQGAFRIPGTTPGDYTVFALQNVEEGEWHSAEVLQSLSGKGAAVTLKEGSRESVKVTLAR